MRQIKLKVLYFALLLQLLLITLLLFVFNFYKIFIFTILFNTHFSYYRNKAIKFIIIQKLVEI